MPLAPRWELDEDATGGLVISCAIDEVALAALRARADEQERCHACDEPIAGEPAGKGLFLWARGEQMQFEETSLCPRCTTAIGAIARRHREIEEEEG
jgi:uncharacterized protein with PIN domain